MLGSIKWKRLNDGTGKGFLWLMCCLGNTTPPKSGSVSSSCLNCMMQNEYRY